MNMQKVTNLLKHLNAFLLVAQNRNRNGWVKAQQLDKLHEVMNHQKHNPEY